ncbi:MAG: V-type ATPase 116kDa subunit family protein, partial [Candidatus Bathyarchaeota archaeon]|nr:V-type ATPase 116kDa subunit family protein [Candidatus Bathyarchaeota archaeon]
EFKPAFLAPAWKLTALRGWPSAHEINPMYITILIFSFQFGLMFGDIGQGAVFLIAGLIISRKFKKGMVSKLGTLFIPMGVFAILFGIGYDSIFLVEGLLFHHHQFMPNPINETTALMKWVFKIAAVEIVFGLVLGAINQWKAGHRWGILGQHGLGMILYIVGLSLSVFEFIRISDFMGVLSYWGFYVMLAGMVLAMLTPIIAAVAGGHFTIEVIGEGVGALLMTFVEGLANLFSFLRIVAFALAHASLAGAAHQLAGFMGNIPSLILMNLIAMTFEFMSSGVQSLRLLYYEFMSKFYHGEGMPFSPFRIRIKKS